MRLFDGDKSSRYHFYKDYKHSRAPMPQILKDALVQFKAAIEETGIVVFEPINDEADDIIATLANKASHNNISSVIVSTDKGFLPFLNEHIAVYDYFKKHYLDQDSIKQRFGEDALNDDALNASLRKKLTENMDMYVISKQLVSLRTDINLGFSLKQLRLN